jgi:hypothetical protein
MKVGTLVIPETRFLKSGYFTLYTNAKQSGRFHIGEIGIVIGVNADKRDHMVRIYTSGGAIGNIPVGNLEKI